MELMCPLTRRAFVAGLGATLPAVAWAQEAPALPPPAQYPSHPARYPRGLKLPADLVNRMRAQHTTTQAVQAKIMANPAAASTLTAANPRLASGSAPDTLPSRYIAPTTPVKNQMQCGSCWAFAAAGAYEAAYLILNNKTINVSVQEILDCTFAEITCVTGGFTDYAFLYMTLFGVADGNTYPYGGAKGSCTSNIDRSYQILNWGFADPDNTIAGDTAIKQAIYRYGPVAGCTDATVFDGYHNTAMSWFGFRDGVLAGPPSDPKKPEVNHCVLIAGWDDSKGDRGAWYIKNSWDTDWGVNGYMWLAYGTCNIGTGAAWVQPVPVKALSESLTRDVSAIHRSNPLLASYPSLGRLK